MSILSRALANSPSVALPEPTAKQGECFTHSKTCVCGYKAANAIGMDSHLKQMDNFKIKGHRRASVKCHICFPPEETDIIDTPGAHECLCGECFALLENLVNHIVTAPDQIEHSTGRYRHGNKRWRKPSEKRIEKVLSSIKSEIIKCPS